MRVVGCRSDDAGDLRSEHERRVRPVLVQAAGQQRVREGHPGGVHLDDHAVASGFVDVGHLDRVRTIQPSHLCCAHAISIAKTRPVVSRCRLNLEPARNPHHSPAGECPGAQLVEHADDVFDVDLGGDRVQMTRPQ